MRKPVVGVMGGAKASEKVVRLAHRLGELIAENGWILLNGGRNTGVMAASAEGAHSAGGTVVGILPDRTRTKASPYLDIAIMTDSGDGRNLFNVLSADVVVACPGALGTLSEIVYALKHDKRVVLLGFDLGTDFGKYRKTGQIASVMTPEEAVEQVRTALESLN